MKDRDMKVHNLGKGTESAFAEALKTGKEVGWFVMGSTLCCNIRKSDDGLPVILALLQAGFGAVSPIFINRKFNDKDRDLTAVQESIVKIVEQTSCDGFPRPARSRTGSTEHSAGLLRYGQQAWWQ
jgi:hypothetical protein